MATAAAEPAPLNTLDGLVAPGAPLSVCPAPLNASGAAIVGAMVGAVAYARALALWALLSALGSAFYIWPNSLSLSALRRPTGMSGRCSLQNT